MSTIASQITSLTIVYSTIYSGADQSKHQSSVSLAFVWGIHRGPVNFPHKWPVTRKKFPFDDVIMLPYYKYNYLIPLSHYAVKDAWVGGLSRFLITVSLRSKGSMDHANVFFAFVNVLYREHKYQSTSDGHKSHLCFLIIANRKTNRGWFGSLFVFPTEWHQTGKQRTAYAEEVVFLFFFLIWCCK